MSDVARRMRNPRQADRHEWLVIGALNSQPSSLNYCPPFNFNFQLNLASAFIWRQPRRVRDAALLQISVDQRGLAVFVS